MHAPLDSDAARGTRSFCSVLQRLSTMSRHAGAVSADGHNNRDMSRPPTPLPHHLAERAFTRAEAAAAGLPEQRLHRRDLTRLAPGVYVSRALELGASEVIAARAASWPQSVVAAVSAATIYGFPLPTWMRPRSVLDPTHVYLPPKHRLPSTSMPRKAYRRFLHDSDVRTVHLTSSPREFRIMTRERTWLSLAELIPFDYLVAIGDHLVRHPRPRIEAGRHGPYTTISELHAVCARYPGIPGIRAARAALDLVRVGADSVQETRLRLGCHAAGLPPARLNQPITDDSGTVLAIPDLSFGTVVVEFDGSHHRDLNVFVRDRDKDLIYHQRGLTVVRIYYSDLPSPIAHQGKDRILGRLARSRAVDLIKDAYARAKQERA